MSDTTTEHEKSASEDTRLPLFEDSEFIFSDRSAEEVLKATAEYKLALTNRARELAAGNENVQIRHVEQARAQLTAGPLDWVADLAIMFILPFGFMLVGLLLPPLMGSISGDAKLDPEPVIAGIVGVALVAGCYGANSNRYRIKSWRGRK